jgi:trk system potassium uptake protein TrkH
LNLFLARPSLLFLFALLAFTTVGTGLLMLPMATASGDPAPFLTAFFTATSALTTTGLSVETTSTYWSFFGQMMTLILIFIGGFGFMAAVTFLLIAVRQQFLLSERVLVRDSLGFPRMDSLLPLVRRIMVLYLVVTSIGAVPLFWRFHHYLPWPEALWQAVYTSVSAFNTAGFDIVGPAGQPGAVPARPIYPGRLYPGGLRGRPGLFRHARATGPQAVEPAIGQHQTGHYRQRVCLGHWQSGAFHI